MGAAEATPVMRYYLLEQLAKTVCEVSPAAPPVSADRSQAWHQPSCVCRKRHLLQLMKHIRETRVEWAVRLFLPLVFLCLHLGSWLFAFGEALFAALLLVPPLWLAVVLFAPRRARARWRVATAAAVSMYGQTMPLLINALLLGPVHHFARDGAAAGDPSAMRWALDGVEPPSLPSGLYFLLHLALTTQAILVVLARAERPPHDAAVLQGVPLAGAGRATPAVAAAAIVGRELDDDDEYDAVTTTMGRTTASRGSRGMPSASAATRRSVTRAGTCSA